MIHKESYQDEFGNGYSVPSNEREKFSQAVPNATATHSFVDQNGNSYNVPEADLEKFHKTVPNARQMHRLAFEDGSEMDVPDDQMEAFYWAYRHDPKYKADREASKARAEAEGKKKSEEAEKNAPRKKGVNVGEHMLRDTIGEFFGGYWEGVQKGAAGMTGGLVEDVPAMLMTPIEWIAANVGAHGTADAMHKKINEYHEFWQPAYWNQREDHAGADVAGSINRSLAPQLATMAVTGGATAGLKALGAGAGALRATQAGMSLAVPAMYGGQAFHDMYEEAVQMGADEDQALKAANISGFANWSLEAVSDLIGIGAARRAAEQQAMRTMRPWAVKTVKALLKGADKAVEMGVEGGTEYLQSKADSVARQIAAGKQWSEIDWAAGNEEALKEAAMVIPQVGAMMLGAAIGEHRQRKAFKSYLHERFPDLTPMDTERGIKAVFNDPDMTRAWAATHPEEAAALVGSDETPSRKQWNKTGLPNMSAEDRKAIRETVREQMPEAAKLTRELIEKRVRDSLYQAALQETDGDEELAQEIADDAFRDYAEQSIANKKVSEELQRRNKAADDAAIGDLIREEGEQQEAEFKKMGEKAKNRGKSSYTLPNGKTAFVDDSGNEYVEDEKLEPGTYSFGGNSIEVTTPITAKEAFDPLGAAVEEATEAEEKKAKKKHGKKVEEATPELPVNTEENNGPLTEGKKPIETQKPKKNAKKTPEKKPVEPGAKTPVEDAKPEVRPDTAPAVNATMQQGGAFTTSTPKGNKKYQGKMRIVNADQVITSDDPRFAELGGIQNRRRFNNRQSDENIDDRARNWDMNQVRESPISNTGAPFAVRVTALDKNGEEKTYYVVQSGNGRMMSRRKAAEYGTDKEYNAMLDDYASKYGVERDEGGDTLIHVLDDHYTPAEIAEFARLSNESNVEEMTAAEKAQNDVGIVQKLVPSMNVDATGDLFTKGNKEFVDAFLAEARDSSLLNPDGTPNKDESERRIRRALLAAMIGDRKASGGETTVADLAISNGDTYGIKLVNQGVTSAAPALLSIGDKNFQLNAELAQAYHAYINFKESGGSNFAEFLSQPDMFEGEYPAVVQGIAMELFGNRNRSSSRTMALLKEYARLAGEQGNATEALFEMEANTKESLWDQAVKNIQEKFGETESLFEQDREQRRMPSKWTKSQKRRVEAAVNLVGNWLGLKVNFAEKAAAGAEEDVRSLRNDKGKVVGKFNLKTREVTFYPGADVDTVMHELGWHATYEWARQNDADLYRQMREYAENAPESVKAAVRESYGTDLSAEELLDELGAARFTAENNAALAKAVETAEGKTWFGKVWDSIKRAWNGFVSSLGGNRADLDKIKAMDPADGMAELAKAMAGGKTLGKLEARSETRQSDRFAINGVKVDDLTAGDLLRAFVTTDKDTYSWEAISSHAPIKTPAVPDGKKFESKTTRRGIADVGLASIAKAAGSDGRIEIPGFGRVAVGRDALEHGLRMTKRHSNSYRYLENPETAHAMLVMGDILKNSIPVNEFVPDGSDAKSVFNGTLLLGVFKDGDKIVPVVAMANTARSDSNWNAKERTADIEAIHFLHSVDAKNLQGSQTAQSASQRFLSPTGNQADEISVPKLIELIKDEIPIFSEDVYSHLGEKRPQSDDYKGLRYARSKPGVVHTFMDMDETRAQKTLRRTQDAMNSVKRVEDYYGVKHDDSVYYAEDARYGKDEHGSHELEQKWQKPILDEISKRNVDLGDLDQYLKAKFAKQRNAMIRARDSKNDAGSGMTDADAQAILDAFNNAGKTANLDAVAQKVWALNRHVLDMYVAAGIMSPVQANYWKRHSDMYVPLRDAPIDEDMETGVPTGIGKNVTRHAIGRGTEASGSPLAYSFVQAQQAVLRCNKNAVRQKLAAMVQAHPEMGRVLDMQPMKKIYAPGRGKNVWVADKSFNENERADVVQVKIGGELKFVQLNGIQGELMARAITHKGMAQWPELLHWIPATTKWMAAMRTSYVPTFLLRNSLIDNRQVMANMTMDGFGKQVAKFEANIPSAMRCAFGYFKNGQPTGQLASLFTEYLENGGLIGGAASEGYNEVNDKIKRILKKGVTPRARIKSAMETLSSTGETSTRFAVYAALRQAGVDVGKAVSYSRDVTVNFNRKGEWTPITNSLFMFSNAAIQDMERTLRSWTNKEAGRMGRQGAAKRVMAAMVFLGALESLIGHLQDDDDKEKNGDPQYKNMSEWQKQTNWNLMFGKKYFHAPVRGFNALLPYFGKKAVDMAFGEDAGQAAKDVLGFTAATSLDFLPSQFLDSENYAVSILNDIAPTFLQPIVQLATNKKFTGEDLTNSRFDKNTPKSENGKRSTANPYQWAAKKLNTLSGGNEGKRGALDFAPEEIQTSLEALFGGVMADVSRVIGLGLDAFNHDLSVDRAPIARDVVRNVPDNTSRFWEAVEKQKKLETEAKALRKRPDKTGIRELIEKHPSARQEQAKTIDGLVKTVRELSEAEREATGDRRDKIRARRLKLQARVLELAE